MADEIGGVVGPWAMPVPGLLREWRRGHKPQAPVRSALALSSIQKLYIFPCKIAIGRAAKPMNRAGGYSVFTAKLPALMT